MERFYMEPRREYRRNEDMSPFGFLSLFMEDDGDVILTACHCEDGDDIRRFQQASVQFCTFAGGGQSQRVREALIKLAEAITLDNQERPQQRSNTRNGVPPASVPQDATEWVRE